MHLTGKIKTGVYILGRPIKQVGLRFPKFEVKENILKILSKESLSEMDYKRRNPEEIIKFFDQCKKFNWFYDRSDDIEDFRNGSKNQQKLYFISLSRPVLNKIYNDFYKWARHAGKKPELKKYL